MHAACERPRSHREHLRGALQDMAASTGGFRVGGGGALGGSGGGGGAGGPKVNFTVQVPEVFEELI